MTPMSIGPSLKYTEKISNWVGIQFCSRCIIGIPPLNIIVLLIRTLAGVLPRRFSLITILGDYTDIKLQVNRILYQGLIRVRVTIITILRKVVEVTL